MKWLDDNRIEIKPVRNPKRITGTRFASVLGLNNWASPFEAWCAITRTYEKPFIDNKYTLAGKAIEPNVTKYLNEMYFRDGLKTPTDIYGENYFQRTRGNFFPRVKVFGGMWDALYYKDNKVEAVIEIKTTKRAEDWRNGSPDYYALQASLYAYNLGIDKVVMSVSFLQETDYIEPERFIPSAENTNIESFKVSERYPNFHQHIQRALEWWDEHVITGISPQFDEYQDAEILEELRKRTIEADVSIEDLIKEGEVLKDELEKVKLQTKDSEKRLKEITKEIRDHCMTQFKEGDDKVVIEGGSYDWILSKSSRASVDTDLLEQDGLLDKYTVEKESYRFSQKAKE